MAKLKLVISDPKTGKSQITELEGAKATPLIGRSIGETIDGSIVGLGGKKLLITGGTDKDGFPMKANVHGGIKAKIIISQGIGYHARFEGERRRKTVRGEMITEDIVQVNTKIIEDKTETKTEKKAEAKK
jgi:small subunit ribosomal protein S6e